MINNNWSELRRELALHDFQLMYLQSEQRKRQEEVDALELRVDHFKQRTEILERAIEKLDDDIKKRCAYYDLITSPEFIKRVEDPALRKKLKRLARIWKKSRPSQIFPEGSSDFYMKSIAFWLRQRRYRGRGLGKL